jgi:branched-chain amino acid transport system substrate-binding protein
MKEFLADYDIEVVAEETFEPTDTDMTAQLTAIKGSDAEAVVLWSAGSAAAIVAQNMDALEMGIPLFGSHGNARKEFIDGAGEAAEGFKFAAGKILIPESYGEGSEGYEVATDFINDYTAEYGVEPNTFAGHAYDALMITVEAMMRLDGEFTPSELRDEIENTTSFVGIGGTFTFSDTDHNGMTVDDIVMYEVQDGDWVLAE